MNLEQKITEALKAAMKDKDKVALDSLRAIKSQILSFSENRSKRYRTE